MHALIMKRFLITLLETLSEIITLGFFIDIKNTYNKKALCQFIQIMLIIIILLILKE